MKTAKDIMTKSPLTFHEADELIDVASRFLQNHISSAPINDAREKTIGILTEEGLMKCFLILSAKPAQKIHLKDVTNLLDAPVFVSYDDPLDKVLKTMITSKTGRVLVLGISNRTAGIISPSDILSALSVDLLSMAAPADKKSAGGPSVTAHVGEVPKIPNDESIYSRFIEHAPYMIHSIDMAGIVQLANRKTHATLGYNYPELIGKKFETLYLEKYWDAGRQGLKQAKRKGDVQKELTSMVQKSGISLPVEIQTSGLFDKTEKFLGTISIVRALDQDTTVTSVMDLIGIFDEYHESKARKNQKL